MCVKVKFGYLSTKKKITVQEMADAGSKRMQDPHNPKRWLTTQEIQEFRANLFEEQGGLCHWCKQPMQLLQPIPDKQNVGNVATFEHLKDRLSTGGRSRRAEDIVASCSSCNGARNKERERIIQSAINEYCGGDVSKKKKLTQGRSMPAVIEFLRSQGFKMLDE